MKTDDVFYEFFRRFPDLLFRLAGLPYEGRWHFESVTVKSTEKRIDGLLYQEGDSTPFYMFVELQGYLEKPFYWRFFREIASWYELSGSDKPFVALVVFLEETHDAQNRTLEPLAPNRFIRLYLREALRRFEHEPGPWVVLEPLVLSSVEEVALRATRWRQTVNALPLTQNDRIFLMEALTQLLVGRFKSLTREEIETMFQLTPFRETVVGQELLEEGRKEGIRAGRQEGIKAGRQEGIKAGRQEGIKAGRLDALRSLLGRLLTARFGPLPEPVQQKLRSIQEPSRLEALAEQVVLAQSLDELKL